VNPPAESASASEKPFPKTDPERSVDQPRSSADDLDLLAEVNHRPSRTTAALIVAILATLTFIGGAVAQKQFGTAAEAAPSGAAGGFPARPGGNTAGFGSFGGGGTPGGSAGGGAGGGTASGATTAATPVAVGTVTKLSAGSLTIKNLGGKSVKITVPEGATITLVAGKGLTTLKTGATVSVAGKVAADGSVTATSVTVRS
jgi:hypothetical protein